MNKSITMFFVALVSIFSVSAQEQEKLGLDYVGQAASMRIVPPLNSRTLTPADIMVDEPKDGRYVKGVKADVVPGKDPQTVDDFLSRNPGKLQGKIDLSRNLETEFIVNNNVTSPSDPDLAVGPDHVYIVFNTGLIIYDKDGNDLTGPFNVNNIFSNVGGCCDLTASYDSAAQRWVLTYLFFTAGMELAVSDGPDPLTANWFVYSFPQVSDYNKLSVWRDGYYITDNGATDVWVIDRDAALAGNPNANIQGFTIPGVQGQNFTSAQVFNVADDNMPTTGGAPLVYMRDDGFAGVTTDQVNIWTVNVDFNTPANSSVSAPEEFVVTPFINVFDGGSFSNLTQPANGSDIDALQSAIMNQAQFRKFATHNSAIMNFVVDTDAGPGELAGIRWYEFRQDGDGMPWTMFQEGTYTAPNGKHAWNGSMSIDRFGNIGLGYASMAGPTTPNPTANRVGAFYTGRFASDDPGVMSIAETLIGIANTNIIGVRYADYAKMDIDPVNGREFWFITEYTNTNHVARFQIAPDFANDIGVVSIDSPSDGVLTNAEDVTITIFNFGTEDASNFDVTYQIDGGAVVTETFTGTLSGGGNSASYTFATQADFSVEGQTYTITASTSLTIDEDTLNDAITESVTHLNSNDVGVTALINPQSGMLGDTEVITIEITNFGSSVQTSIPVFYAIDGGTPVEEVYTGSIESGATENYTFAPTVDLSVLGDYAFSLGTALDTDADATNDILNVEVSNLICMPQSNCAQDGDGVTELTLADQNITTECGTAVPGYADNTDVIFNFVLNDNPFEGVLQVGFNATEYAIWIDFNDNTTFEEDELISNELVANANVDFNFTIDLRDFPNVQNGMHFMRVKAEFQTTVGQATDPCGDQAFGRTNDYTANITGSLGLNDADFGGTDLQIISRPNSQFEVIFENNISFDQKLPITVYNTLGQKLAYYTIENTGGAYRKTIDMSYAATGVYFIRVGDETLNKTRKIIVQ